MFGAINMTLSVLVITSPGRETQLNCCLEMLTRQSFQDFMVVVADDGSQGGEQVARRFRQRLRLKYLHRPNDCCPSRSRNLAAQNSDQEELVFIDSDVLLNPYALEYYRLMMEMDEQAECLFFGYYGNREYYHSPSAWFPDYSVMWEDVRFPCEEITGKLLSDERLYSDPARWAWSGNFAMPYSAFAELEGFNEAFVGWGQEDHEFAIRALQHDFQIHFTMDAWGEHLVHDKCEPFHLLSPANVELKQAYLEPLLPFAERPVYQVVFYGSQAQSDYHTRMVHSHYWPTERFVEPDYYLEPPSV